MIKKMNAQIELLGIYLHLARSFQGRRQLLRRDRMLVLAGQLSAQLKLDRIAAYCRHLVLAHNPGHMVGHWPSLSVAIRDADFDNFCRIIRKRYPRERAEQLLEELGIRTEGEREAYFSDDEYAAALLGTDLAEIESALQHTSRDGQTTQHDGPSL